MEGKERRNSLRKRKISRLEGDSRSGKERGRRGKKRKEEGRLRLPQREGTMQDVSCRILDGRCELMMEGPLFLDSDVTLPTGYATIIPRPDAQRAKSAIPDGNWAGWASAS